MSIKPTMHLKLVIRVTKSYFPSYGTIEKVLRQKWVDEADARIFEWRDIELVEEAEPAKKDDVKVFY